MDQDFSVGDSCEPVFWWWEESGGTRVLLLTPDVLVLTGALTPMQVAALEEARQAGDMLSADVGSEVDHVALARVTQLQYVPAAHQVRVVCGSDGPTIIEPPASSGGVAAGIFEVLQARLAPGVTPDEATNGEAGEDASTLDVRLMAAFGVAGLISLVLGVRAEEGAQFDGLLASFRQGLNDMFVSLGLIPAGLALAAIVGLQIRRLKNGRPLVEDLARGERFLTVVVDSQARAARVEAVLGESEDFDRPLLGPADEEDPLAALLAPSTDGEAPPAPSSDPVVAPVASSPAEAPSVAHPMPEPMAAPDSSWSAPASDTTAWSAAGTVVGEHVADAQIQPPPPGSWGEPAEAEAAGGWGEPEPVVAVEPPLPPPPAPVGVPEPVIAVEPPLPPPPAPVGVPEPVVAVEPPLPPPPAPVGVPEPVVAAHRAPLPAPVEPEPEPAPAAAGPAPEPAAPAASSAAEVAQRAVAAGFESVAHREPPRPPWASAPEPTSQIVDPATVERSVPAQPPVAGPEQMVDSATAEAALGAVPPSQPSLAPVEGR